MRYKWYIGYFEVFLCIIGKKHYYYNIAEHVVWIASKQKYVTVIVYEPFLCMLYLLLLFFGKNVCYILITTIEDLSHLSKSASRILLFPSILFKSTSLVTPESILSFFTASFRVFTISSCPWVAWTCNRLCRTRVVIVLSCTCTNHFKWQSFIIIIIITITIISFYWSYL